MTKQRKKSLLMDFCFNLSEADLDTLKMKPDVEEVVDNYLEQAGELKEPVPEKTEFTKGDLVFNCVMVGVVCLLLGMLANPFQAAVEYFFFGR